MYARPEMIVRAGRTSTALEPAVWEPVVDALLPLDALRTGVKRLHPDCKCDLMSRDKLPSGQQTTALDLHATKTQAGIFCTEEITTQGQVQQQSLRICVCFHLACIHAAPLRVQVHKIYAYAKSSRILKTSAYASK